MEKRLMTFIACLFLSLGMALAQTQVSGKVTSAISKIIFFIFIPPWQHRYKLICVDIRPTSTPTEE